MKSWLDIAGEKARGSLKRAQQQILEIDRTKLVAPSVIVKEYYAKGVEVATQTYERLPLSKLLETSERLVGTLSQDSKSALTKLNERFIKASNETPSLSDEERLEKSIESLSGKDRIGLLGDGAAVVIGSLGGAAAASSIATAAGASTLLGSTTLASALGGVFVTATPVGWVIGSALVLGAAGYGTGKLIRSGSEQDKVRAELINKLTQRLQAIGSKETGDAEKTELMQLCATCIAGGVLDQQGMERMLQLVEEKKMPVSIAVDRLKRKAMAANLIEMTTNQIDTDR